MLTDKLNETALWLSHGAPSGPRPGQMLQDFCERLIGAGIPLWRTGLFVRTLHPDIIGRNFIWRPGTEVVSGTATFDMRDSPEYKTSPLAIVFEQMREVRHRLDPAAPVAFPVFAELQAEGVTDYIALPLPTFEGTCHASSWTTKQPGGFTDAQLDALRSFVPALTRVIEIVRLQRTATVLLDTYVGNRAGERILAGQIRRGHTETMSAVIWLSDLRGFTRLSDQLPPEAVVEILNSYFDCQVQPILKNGGEVLKFMGDGLLAVFPISADGGDTAEVCARVLEAAAECRAGVAAMRYADGTHTVERFRFGLALHVGKILYGNIGGGNRLDFTCIGPAVNLAARLEKIASNLGRTVVASSSFAETFVDGWTDLGEFPVAGFAREERVFGLHDEQPLSG